MEAEAPPLGDLAVHKSSLMDRLLVKVRTGLGGLEAVAAQQIDVRLYAVPLVVRVGNGLDLVKAQFRTQFVLDLEDAFDARHLDGHEREKICSWVRLRTRTGRKTRHCRGLW